MTSNARDYTNSMAFLRGIVRYRSGSVVIGKLERRGAG